MSLGRSRYDRVLTDAVKRELRKAFRLARMGVAVEAERRSTVHGWRRWRVDRWVAATNRQIDSLETRMVGERAGT